MEYRCAADCVSELKKVFGLMGNLWKFFYYSPKKNRSIEGGASCNWIYTIEGC